MGKGWRRWKGWKRKGMRLREKKEEWKNDGAKDKGERKMEDDDVGKQEE